MYKSKVTDYILHGNNVTFFGSTKCDAFYGKNVSMKGHQCVG